MNIPSLPEAPEDEAPEDKAGAAPAPQAKRAARLLPQPRMGGLMPWVIAILIALVVIAAAGGPNPDLRAARGKAVVGVLQDMELVRAVRLVPEDELAALLEPWLGTAANSGDVPIPVLVDVELVRRATPAEIARLAAALEGKVPGARVDAQSDWLRPVYRALAALQWLALGLIGLVGLATAAAVWLASRNALGQARETVEILHLLGGTDRQITHGAARGGLRGACRHDAGAGGDLAAGPAIRGAR
jgi:cell division transport system permease protein